MLRNTFIKHTTLVFPMSDLDLIESSKDKLNNLFTRLKELNEIKKMSSTKIVQLIKDAKEMREFKKKLTETVRTNKQNREEVNKKLKKLFNELKPIQKEREKFGETDNPRFLQTRIDKIEWTIMTENVPFKKEQEMTKERLVLEEQLEKALERHSLQKDERSLFKKIKELRQEQRLFHMNVISNSQEWDKVNAAANELSGKIDKLRDEFMPIEDEIKQVRSRIDELKGKVKEGEFNVKEKQDKNEKKIISEKLEVLKEKFKKNKKLTNDDLLILQSSDEELSLE